MDTEQDANEQSAGGVEPSTIAPIQSHQVGESQSDRGLLDLAIELSLLNITAGSNFTLFVKIKNPFAKPIW